MNKTKRAPDITYAEALDKLTTASKRLNTLLWDMVNGTVEGEPWDIEVWKRLCRLVQATMEAEWAYRRTNPRRKPDAVP